MPFGDRHSPKADSDEVEDADGPLRHEIHQRDQEHAENGIGRRFRYLIREIGRELDEKCPDEDTRNRADPADDAADQEITLTLYYGTEFKLYLIR